MKANGVTHTTHTNTNTNTSTSGATDVIGSADLHNGTTITNFQNGATKQQRHGRAFKLKQLFHSKQHHIDENSRGKKQNDLLKQKTTNVNDSSGALNNDQKITASINSMPTVVIKSRATLSPCRLVVAKRKKNNNNKHCENVHACVSGSASAPVTPVKCLHVPWTEQQQQEQEQQVNCAANKLAAREQKNRSKRMLGNLFTLPTWMQFMASANDKATTSAAKSGGATVIKLSIEKQQQQQQQTLCNTTNEMRDTITNGAGCISAVARDGVGCKPSVRFAPECRLPSDSSQSSEQPSLSVAAGSNNDGIHANDTGTVATATATATSTANGGVIVDDDNSVKSSANTNRIINENEIEKRTNVIAKEMVNKEVQTEREVNSLGSVPSDNEPQARGLNRRSSSCRARRVSLLSQRFGADIGADAAAAAANAGDTCTTSNNINDNDHCATNNHRSNMKPDGSKLASCSGSHESQNGTANITMNRAPSGECPMSTDKFRVYGRQLIDYIGDFADTIGKRRVTPLNIEPGYLRTLLPVAAPHDGEPFPEIMQDFEKHIMRGITHWQHPRFHAYFPAGNAYPSILADMLSDAIGCVGFSWAASPACTELEIIMLDWMGKMIGLPEEFLCLSRANSKGGGVIQGSASECVLVNMLAARYAAIERLRKKYPNTPDGTLLTKLIGYCSKESHSCVEKAAMISFIKMRALDTDDKYALRGDTLAKAIKTDLANGLEPFLVSATLGTTSCCSFDNIDEVGRVCHEHNLWLHVDAAYAGSALICPEFKYLMRGIEFASSFNMNPNKWMLINFDCSLMWVKDRFQLTRAFVVDPLYLQHSFSDQAIDYRHWGIPLSRRFRSLKLWFVIRNYGVSGLQNYIRNHVKLAKQFEQLLLADKRFEIINQVVLGLVCFRLIGSNALNQRLLSNINASGKLHMVPASLNGRYIIRFCVCAQDASEKDIVYSFQCIAQFATELFESIEAGRERIRAISQQNTIDVSDVSLHTQQSVASEAGSGSTLPTLVPSERSLSRQMSSPGVAATYDHTQRPSSSLVAPMRSATNSAVVSPNGADGEQQQADRANNIIHDIDDDLEEEIILDSLVPEEDEDDDDDEDDEEEEEEEEEGEEGDDDAENARHSGKDSASTTYEKRAAGRGNSNNNKKHTANDKKATQHEDEAEARDEVFTLNKRNRMSLRYKRGFFVRVVSDPKMYRVSISGDIGDSSGSIGSAN